MGLLLILHAQNVFVFPKNLRASPSRFLETKSYLSLFQTACTTVSPFPIPKTGRGQRPAKDARKGRFGPWGSLSSEALPSHLHYLAES